MKKKLRYGLKPLKKVSLFTFCVLFSSPVFSQETNKWVESREERLSWHEAARFGAMVHFSPDTYGKMYYYDGQVVTDPYRGRPIPAEEFDRYYTQMTLKNFSADEWVKTFADAGMKYFIFVAKHHNGFCMWDSKYTNYDIYAVTGRDVVKELADACEKYGLTFCLYYSIMDWYHPHATGDSHGGKGYELPPGIEPDLENYILYMNAQLKELATNYGKIGLFWYDGAWMSEWTDNPKLQWTQKHAKDLYDYTMSLQDGITCNNRMQREHYRMVDNLGDYYTPENFIGNFDRKDQWESIIKLGESWHWRQGERIKTLEELQRILCTCAGSDGNLSLNIGPHPEGFILPKQVERLNEFGAWLKENGEAIYDTRGGPYLPSKNMVSTCNEKSVYLHVFKWVEPGKLKLPSLKAKVKSCKVGDQEVSFKTSKKELQINVPETLIEKGVTIVKLELEKADAFKIDPIKLNDVIDNKVNTKQKIDTENL